MKFLYILVSEEKDIYYEQTLASALSLRHYNPDAFVTLLVDDRTDKNLVGFRGEIKNLVNEYKVVPFDESMNNMLRSRMLKTNMRAHVEGDFLFIDGDTAIVAPLEIPDDWPDVAAVADLHAKGNDKYHVKHKKLNRNIAKMHFSQSFENVYFNSGVVFFRDNPAARAFGEEWHRLYLQCAENGIFTDQLSFNETNHRLGFPLAELDGEWNCQVREAYNHLYRVKTIYPILCRARIIHFFSTGIDGKKEPHPLMRKDFFEGIKSQGALNDGDRKIIVNARNGFFGAPETYDVQVRFPMFFIYRQWPNLCRFLVRLKEKLK